MPFLASRPLERMLDPTAVPKAGRAMTRKAGRTLRHDTAALTPVHVPEPGADPRLRKPGTLKRSIKAEAVRAHVGATGAKGWRVRVFTDDPIAPYVEWSTRPHVIRPRADRAPASVTATGRARGTRQDGRAALRFVVGGRVVYAKVVHHPGTRGEHMFARAAAILDVNVHRMFSPELEQFGRDLTGMRSGTVTDRRSR